jgi:uncharacterized C2H2 Zn-finger protein
MKCPMCKKEFVDLDEFSRHLKDSLCHAIANNNTEMFKKYLKERKQ